MHLVIVVVEMKGGHKVVTINNNSIYVSADNGPLEPYDTTWLWSLPPADSVVRGCIFDCGSVKETTLGNNLR